MYKKIPKNCIRKSFIKFQLVASYYEVTGINYTYKFILMILLNLLNVSLSFFTTINR